MILSSDKVKTRVKMVERFVELAKLLRTQHNYSGLRCVVVGINFAVPDRGEVMTAFRNKSRQAHKSLQSYDMLLKRQWTLVLSSKADVGRHEAGTAPLGSC